MSVGKITLFGDKLLEDDAQIGRTESGGNGHNVFYWKDGDANQEVFLATIDINHGEVDVVRAIKTALSRVRRN
ncbi:MAG: hypothetical protein F8N15_10590 [Methanobacterium sp.]|nr:hypothetical protein [Methanobacterium sp.]